MKNNPRTRGYHGLICGTILALVGIHMLAVKMGWISGDLLRSVPFFPLALIFFGGLIIYSSIFKKNRGNGTDHQAGSC